jgi:NAD-dependent histone deacetylase SIR2/NAD-dependent deacetylase sirtuin 1
MGAGASTWEDFRSPGGLYDTIRRTSLLKNPYQIFDLSVFESDPSIF